MRLHWCRASGRYVWHTSKFTREVLDRLIRIGFLHHQADHLEQGTHRFDSDALLIPTRAMLRSQKECTKVRQSW
jgi:hypothetical protein